MNQGPLAGLTLIEIASIGPGPMAAMLLADMGAHVIRVERMEGEENGLHLPRELDPMLRSRHVLALDLKKPEGLDVLLRLVKRADALIEGFRPGVAERLGFGPDVCHALNRALVYGRVTGYGQAGPMAAMAGHDINYISLTGALHAIGEAGRRPLPPLNLVGDYGGGALYLALGVVCAVLKARQDGAGTVVDAAMVDGSASLMTIFSGLQAQGSWHSQRGTNILDGGAPFYGTYETSDGLHMAVGAIEPKFFAILASMIGLEADDIARQYDERCWPALREKMRAIFIQRSREEWCAVFDGTDACVTPVLSLGEAPDHPHLAARGTFRTEGSITYPAPAPRFGQEGKSAQTRMPEAFGQQGPASRAILENLGYSHPEIDALFSARCAG